MKIDAFGPLQQPDPKEEKQKASQRDDRDKSFPPNKFDSIKINKDIKEPSSPGYAGRTGKSNSMNRSDKDIDDLKHKSASGYYDTYEIKDKTSEKLIDSQELEDVVEQYRLSSLSQEVASKKSVVRFEKIAEAKKKIADGFFNNPANFEAIADKILDHFKI
jgi:anti-sigma28 factor (negative regulator of flagellin synthesis)